MALYRIVTTTQEQKARAIEEDGSVRRKIALSLALIALVSVFTAGLTSAATASSVSDEKTIVLPVNGERLSFKGISLNDATYIRADQVQELLQQGLVIFKTIKSPIDPYQPTIDLKQLGIAETDLQAIRLEEVANRAYSFPVVSVEKGRLTFLGSSPYTPVLKLEQEYILKAFTSTSKRYEISFKTSGLPTVQGDNTKQIILVPAMPEKGFYWPYILLMPTDRNKSHNSGHKRYLFVDTNNTGSSYSFSDTINNTIDRIDGSFAARPAEALWSPLLMPVFLRPPIRYNAGSGDNCFYTHALDRDTAILHLLLEAPKFKQELTQAFGKEGLDVDQFVRLDQQLVAMIDHAIEYLNGQGQNLEQKVFLSGYSASGTFTDRFAALHPNKVKAVASGAALDDMMLPLANHKGEKLIFPIGTSDYDSITGRAFDLEAHNQVAKLVYMGEDDENNTLPYPDCYGNEERRIITKLWGAEVLPRAKSLIELYDASGGQGMFIFDRGEKHGASRDIKEYMLEFFRANRDSQEPVYPVPKNPAQLKYTLFND